MTRPLQVALVSPHPLPPRDDVAHHVSEVARALAARGHGVTVLAPATTRERIVAGRARLRAAESGDPSAVVAAPGEVREVAIGRALPAGPGRRVGAPFDLVAALEAAFSHSTFDIVDLHEPLAPSPALAALRHARGVAAVTFHRAEPLAGVALLRPLVDRALSRADLRIATAAADAEALSEILPGEYVVIPPGVDLDLFPPSPPLPDAGAPPPLALVARGRDRAGVRFALGILRSLDLTTIGAVTLVGPPEAPWRTRAAVPKALRERVTVIPDTGPEARAAALSAGAIAVLASPEDASGPAMREALAAGCAVVAPRSRAVDEVARHGIEALVLPPFSRELWSAAVADLAADGARRSALGAAARRRRRGWGDVAKDLEGAYLAAIESGRGAAPSHEGVVADMRVRPAPDVTPERVVAACRERGIGAVAVAAPEGIETALAVAAAARDDLAVVVGQEIATTDGALIGLFLVRDIEPGLDPVAAAAAVHAQGGVVMAPHPDGVPAPPSPAALRRLGGAVDCVELLNGPAEGQADEETARMAQRMGVLGCAGSGAGRAEDVGAAVTELRAFHGASDFLDALAEARLGRPPRRRRVRQPQPRRRGRRVPDS